jgi:nitroreductase
MDVIQAIRTTGACRRFTPDPLPDDVLERLSGATHMANHFAEIPAIYPSVQNLMLAARNEGLGTTLTTILCAFEPQLKHLLGIPAEIVFSDHYGRPFFPPES